MTDVEFRPFAEPVEVRSVKTEAGNRLVLSGTAIRYGARSRDLGGFRERIMPGAAKEPIQKGDVHAYEEHRSERYLGRTGNGSLRLFDSKSELRYEVDLPDTAVGREVAALAERGDYAGSSFGFRSLAAKWSTDTDGTPLRTITAFRSLRDVGPTIAPAYEATTAEAALRHLPAEAELEIEVRSVLEAARTGTLAALLDGAVDLAERDDDSATSTEADPPAEESTPVIHRRPLTWFV
jgi:HK97 family phage prohead protease